MEKFRCTSPLGVIVTIWYAHCAILENELQTCAAALGAPQVILRLPKFGILADRVEGHHLHSHCGSGVACMSESLRA